MSNQEKTNLQAAETAFKQRLFKLGLLTKIAPPPQPLVPSLGSVSPFPSLAMRSPS